MQRWLCAAVLAVLRRWAFYARGKNVIGTRGSEPFAPTLVLGNPSGFSPWGIGFAFFRNRLGLCSLKGPRVFQKNGSLDLTLPGFLPGFIPQPLCAILLRACPPRWLNFSFQLLLHLKRIHFSQVIPLQHRFRTISMMFPERNPALVVHCRLQQHRPHLIVPKVFFYLLQQC
jgi:hypothetical protein